VAKRCAAPCGLDSAQGIVSTGSNELDRQLGSKTMEAEILREALGRLRAKELTLLAGSLKTDGSR
jgi:hypothetical protein